MSTVETYEDVPLPYEVPEHLLIMGASTFRCAMPACDLLHHFWCSCDQAA